MNSISLPKKYQNVKRRLSVKNSSMGLGLFADRPIEKGGFVIEYFGPVLTRKESNEKGGKYLFETSENRVIDGASRENTARYINHSCKPNCEIDILRGRVYVFALRSIRTGEEFSYDYGDEYLEEYIKPFGCQCGICKKAK